MNVDERVRFLGEINPFSILSAELLYSLASNAEEQHYEKNCYIFNQGDASHGYIFVIVSGSAKLVVTDNQNISRVVGYRHSQEFFGETAFFTRDVYPGSAQAAISTHCLKLPESEILPVMQKSLDFTIIVNRLLVDRMRLLYQKFVFEDDVKIESPLLSRKASKIMTSDVFTCFPEDSVYQVASAMGHKSVSSAVVVRQDEEHGLMRPLGIITDRDMVTRVVGSVDQRKATDITAGEIMSRDLVTVTSDAFVYQVFLLMTKHNIKHIVVADNGSLKGVITIKDIVAMQTKKPLTVVTDIESMDSFEDLKEIREKVDKVIYTILHERASANEVCAIVSEYYDRVTRRIVELAERQMQHKGMGKPPSNYCMIIMGSGGRQEQYATTDQDNAIIFFAPRGQEDDYRRYFMQLGEEIVTGLEIFGFQRCKGKVMANNAQWCLSLNEWLNMIEKWSTYPGDLKSIMQMSIFLDFRWIYGNIMLYESLKKKVTEAFVLGQRPLQYLASESALSKGSPVNMFGKVRTLREEGGGRYIDVKRHGCVHVVDCIRIFSLRYGIQETNTIERIHRLMEMNVFGNDFYKDIKDIQEAYESLMKYRILDTYEKIRENRTIDNRLHWDKLTRHEQAYLRQSLVMVKRILSITNYYFKNYYLPV